MAVDIMSCLVGCVLRLLFYLSNIFCQFYLMGMWHLSIGQSTKGLSEERKVSHFLLCKIHLLIVEWETFRWFLPNEPSGHIPIACHPTDPEFISVLLLRTPSFPDLSPSHSVLFPRAQLARNVPWILAYQAFFCHTMYLRNLAISLNIFQLTRAITIDMWMQWKCPDCKGERREGGSMK